MRDWAIILGSNSEIELEGLMARVEAEVRDRDALQGTWNSDGLFGFTVQAILDQQTCPNHLGEDRVWRDS